MSDKPELAPISGDKLTTEFAFSRTSPRPLPNDPKTIINPERRGSSAPPPALSITGLGSSVLNRLFPNEYGSAELGEAVGPAGFELGHFIIQERIGSGGMGAVFSALDTRLDRVVALKVLSPSQARDLSSVQRFQNEARAAAQLDHENIARVHYYGEDRGLQFIAFEFIVGRNVRDLIREAGSLSPAQAVNFTLQMANALRHTSSKGVVHRDIKPSNIIVMPSGRAKLVDLGLARQILTENENELTLAGTTLGTFDYISPEQAKDPRKVDVRSDIYSLGCTLYHMLTGEPPYSEGTVLQKLLDHHGKDPPDPAKKNRRVPPALSALVQKMMASDPKQRHATPDELIWALMPIAHSLGLKSVNTEGLLWAPRSHTVGAFFYRNAGWVAMAVALLAIVLLLERFPSLGKGNRGGEHGLVEASAEQLPTARDEGRATRGTNQSEIGPPKNGSRGKTEIQTSSNAKTGGLLTGEGAHSEPVANSEILVGRSDINQFVPSKLAPDNETDGPALPGPGLFNDPNLSIVTRPGRSTDRGELVDPGSEEVIAPRPGTENPVRTAAVPAVSAPRPFPMSPPKAPTAIAILRADGTEEVVSYPTLEAACTSAADGSVIELRYHGVRPEGSEKPIRIANRKITIRAGAGFRPVVEFVVPRSGSEAAPSRLITLNNGSLELVNLEVRVTVPDNEVDRGDRCSLFTLQGIDKVLLQGVGLTVTNPSRRSFSIVEVVTGTGPDLNNMKMMKTGPGELRNRYEVRVVDSFLRGQGDFVTLRNTEPGRVDLERTVVAVGGTLLSMLGDMQDEAPQEGAHVEVKIDHVTCLVGRGLLRFDSGTLPRYLLPVQISARNNIIATQNKESLVTMFGATNITDFRHKLLRWDGSKNFYQGFDVFWTISLAADLLEAESMPFEAWKRAWGSEQEVAPHSGGVKWRTPWNNKAFSSLVSTDLRLDREAASNPPRGGASDGTDAGADMARFADFFQSAPAPRSEFP